MFSTLWLAPCNNPVILPILWQSSGEHASELEVLRTQLEESDGKLSASAARCEELLTELNEASEH